MFIKKFQIGTNVSNVGRRSILFAALISATLAFATVHCGFVDFSDIAAKRFLGNANQYFTLRPGQSFTELTPKVFTYQDGFNRNLAIRTRDGFVIIDSFNPEFARGLVAELERRFPGQPVHTLFYSHYHLDHVQGGAAFKPLNVVGHRNLARYWRFLDTDEIVPTTATIAGDTTLNIGGVEIRLLDMGLSHTDTLFAFYLPAERVVFAPDLGFVRALPPAGMPDMYYFGYVAALERLAGLDFDIYVPSHFDTGRRQDLQEYVTFLRDTRQWVQTAYDRHGPITKPGVPEFYYDAVYVPLKAKYGDWLGFDEMAATVLVRNLAGTYLGY